MQPGRGRYSNIETAQPKKTANEEGRPRQRGIESTTTAWATFCATTRARLRILIERHHLLTGSKRARQLLEDWDNTLATFVKVMPKDYRRALLELKAEAEIARAAAE